MSAMKTRGKSSSVGIQSPALKWLAWFVLFITLFFVVGTTLLVFTNLSYYKSVGGTGSGQPLIIDILLVPINGVGAVLTTGVGLVILYRSANWQMGWLLLALGGIQSLGGLSEAYTNYAFEVRPEAILPLKWPAAWFQHWGVIIFFYLFLVAFPLLFPTGRPLSRRWGVVLRLSLVYLALVTLVRAFGRGPLEGALTGLDVMNPYGFIPVGEFGWLEGRSVLPIYLLLFLTFTMLAIVSLVLRYRRSPGYERQQIKWIAYVLTIWAVSLWLNLIGSETGLSILEGIGWIVWHVCILGLPLAIGIAILKYRLYDIDRIINRTLVYGVLTSALALVYFTSVALLQGIFPAESPIAIVLSTLAIAALFSPLRRRIQDAIDRRFYRRRYDAQQTLAAFSAQMRDEVELEQLSKALLGVVDETMQPAHVSLWLKEAE
jgi:hypothetical protein